MNIDMVINKMLSPGSTREIDTELSFIETAEASMPEFQKAFDRTLRTNVITRDDIKAKILLALNKRIREKSQMAEYTWPPTGMRTKIKDFKQFAIDIQSTQYEGVGKCLELLLI